jgi:hypothetical protein
MVKRERLTDALEIQRKQEKKHRAEKLRHRRLEQRAEMLNNAVTVEDLREQLKVLQQLAGRKGGQADKRSGGRGEKPRGGLDPLQAKRMAELEERIAILEGKEDDAAGSGSAGGSTRSSSPDTSDDEEEVVTLRGGAVADVAADDAWAAFFTTQPAASATMAAPAVSAPQQPSGSTLYGLKLAAPAGAKPTGTAADITTGKVSIAGGGSATSFVPLAVRRRQQLQPAGAAAAQPLTTQQSTSTTASVRYAAPDPLAQLASASAPQRTDDELEAFLGGVDAADE